MKEVTVKENSILAMIAAFNLSTESVAMVIGNTIYLHNSSKADFLRNKKWVRHELAHVEQYSKLGFLKFIFFYLLETFNKGYKNNKYEVEARERERDAELLSEYHIT